MPAELRGSASLIKAMRTFDSDLKHSLDIQLQYITKDVMEKARSYVPAEVPMRGWAKRKRVRKGKFPLWNAMVIRNGIRLKNYPGKKNREGFTTLVSIRNESAVGAIAETAGRKNIGGQRWVGPKAGGASKGVSRSVNPDAGRQFIQNLTERIGVLKGDAKVGYGRFIYRAWKEDNGVTNARVIKAVEDAITEFDNRVRMAG